MAGLAVAVPAALALVTFRPQAGQAATDTLVPEVVARPARWMVAVVRRERASVLAAVAAAVAMPLAVLAVAVAEAASLVVAEAEAPLSTAAIQGQVAQGARVSAA